MNPTYHREVAVPSTALILDEPLLITSGSITPTKRWRALDKCNRDHNTGISPLVVAVHSSPSYNFYYLENGDRIDMPRS